LRDLGFREIEVELGEEHEGNVPRG
jgi:hypothetical protein